MSGGWNTIESDAGVFTYLVENLGVKSIQFEEMVSLDSDYLKQLAPVYGVIFLFKYPIQQQTTGVAEDGSFDYGATEELFFANQVIQNACGTQAILSVLLNKNEIDIGPDLSGFREFTQAFPSDIRGEALSNSELIRTVHNSFARSSPFVDEGARTATEDDDVYHFIAYTPINGNLYELDGLQPCPISHGACLDEEFCEKVIPVLQRRIGRYPATEIRFNLLAMIEDPRAKAQERGDFEIIAIEDQKRSAWMWENELRRHNFVGFTHEILKCVTKAKLKDGTYDEWIGEAKEKMKKGLRKQLKENGEGEDVEMGL